MLKLRVLSPFVSIGALLLLAACAEPSGQSAEHSEGGGGNQAIAVETAVARKATLASDLAYTGTTEPAQQVSLRSQVEGQLLALSADVGDSVAKGQPLAQIDSRLLQTEVNEAQAELAALQSEVAQAEAEVSDAIASVNQVRVELEQARADAERLQGLVNEGAITQQQAEQAQTTYLATEQALQSAQQQVRTRQQAVIAAQRRVRAQEAVVAQTQERSSYASVASPINGMVLERLIDPGTLVQPGGEILRLGDFSRLKVVVRVSELDLAAIRLGQVATVTLDAFPGETFSGQVTRITPAADTTARLIPVEVEIDSGNRITGGLLARVSFQQGGVERVVVPEEALELGPESGAADNPTVFIVQDNAEGVTAIARAVRVGETSSDGQVEILDGLQPGETYIVESGAPLEDGQSVRLSILSEGSS